MPFLKTDFQDLYIFEPRVFEDGRGYFFESFNQQTFESEAGISCSFVQDNQSKSKYGTLRGLHFQKNDAAQAKLVRVLSGKVLDVVVDLRQGFSTYKKSFSIELSSDNKKQLYVPRGFAHGFVVLSDTAEFLYKCDNFYSPQYESGINFADPDLNIDWLLPEESLLLSDKDKNLPFLRDL